MKVIHTVAEFRLAQREYPRPLGLVPTMGYLHEGHLSLVRRCREDNATAVASVFVNPTQFGPSEDLSTYPRDMDGDLAKLEAEGVDLVFAPDASEMYPDGFDTTIDVGDIARQLEGEHRPRTLSGRGDGRVQVADHRQAGQGRTSGRRTLSNAWSSSG